MPDEEVRPEYAALAEELDFLRGAFALPCTPAQRGEVATTLAAFECIDRHYDAVARIADRRALGEAVVGALRGDAAPLAPELADHVGALRAVFARHAAAERCADLLAEFFATTECVRTTLDPRAYVAAVRREGELTSMMVALLLAEPASPRFARFFVQLGVVGNLVDKLVDVRQDAARGEIAVRATLGVHARLAAAFVGAAAPLAIGFPRPVALARWGLKFFAPMLA